MLGFRKHIAIVATLMLLAEAQEDISCRPRETLVPTLSHKPQFKILHRCSGLQPLRDPARFRCVATEAVDVPVEVMNQIGKITTRLLKNETKCETKCVCGCHGAPYPVSCDSGFRWDNVRCECVPSCMTGKASTGQGEVSGGVSYAILATALVAELVLILIIVFVTLDACKCRRQKKGVIYKTRKYVRSLSAGVAEQKMSLNGELSGSVTFIEGADERARV